MGALQGQARNIAGDASCIGNKQVLDGVYQVDSKTAMIPYIGAEVVALLMQEHRLPESLARVFSLNLIRFKKRTDSSQNQSTVRTSHGRTPGHNSDNPQKQKEIEQCG